MWRSTIIIIIIIRELERRADSVCFSLFPLSRSANLDEAESKKAYEQAYVEILSFFQEHF